MFENIIIYVYVFNNKEITKFSLKNLIKNKQDAKVIIWDDCSTDYDINELVGKIIQNDNNVEIIKNEKYLNLKQTHLLQLKHFMKTDYDFCYFTDNNFIHELNYLNILKFYYNKYNKNPISLYNSINFHLDYIENIDLETVIKSKSCSEYSMFLDRDMVMRVLNKITQKGNIEGNYWDKLVCSILFEKGYNFIITKISYIESLKHNNTLNSTKFLEEEKIKFLKNKWLSFL